MPWGSCRRFTTCSTLRYRQIAASKHKRRMRWRTCSLRLARRVGQGPRPQLAAHAKLKPVSVESRTGLCPAPQIPAGKKFGEARDRPGIFDRDRLFRATETGLCPPLPRQSPGNLKTYSAGARKPSLRRSAWWWKQPSATRLRAKFPGSREFSREFLEKRPRRLFLVSNHLASSMCYYQIPCSTKQGIL